MEFLDVEPVYSYNEDLVCKYTLLDFIPRENDRICLYIVGWSDVKNYEVMEWVSVTDKSEVSTIIFHRKLQTYIVYTCKSLFAILGPSLPTDTTEVYQFCYISGENEVYGASSLFQFVANIQDSFYPSMQHFKTRYQNVKSPKTKEIKELYTSRVLEEKDKEITGLKKEVALLKKTLMALVMKDTIYKEVADQKCSIISLKRDLALQQHEINTLKTQISNNKVYNCNSHKLEIKEDEDTCNIEGQNLFDIGELKELPPFPYQNFT